MKTRISKLFNKIRGFLNYHETFKLKTIFSFLIVAIIPCLVFSAFFYSKAKSIVQSDSDSEIAYFRDSQIKRIEDYYQQIEIQLSGYSNSLLPLFDEATNEVVKVSELDRNSDIKNIYLYSNTKQLLKPFKVILKLMYLM